MMMFLAKDQIWRHSNVLKINKKTLEDWKLKRSSWNLKKKSIH